MNSLRFDIVPSSDSNDHEARILIDGVSWLGDDYMGLDPVDLRGALTDTTSDWLRIGRCCCGCVGCGDRAVRVKRGGDKVRWVDDDIELTFDAGQYDAEIARVMTDHSWEDAGRTTERLVGEIFEGMRLSNGLDFQWASTRVRSGAVALSFSGSDRQVLFEFGWSRDDLTRTLEDARRFRADIAAGTVRPSSAFGGR